MSITRGEDSSIFKGFIDFVHPSLCRYGDKVPRSVAGRLFAVVWINAGLVILAIFMGVITTSLTSSSLQHISHLYGTTVQMRQPFLNVISVNFIPSSRLTL